VAGQAALGFVLPWILAMVAIPLEMLLDSARHVLASLAVLALEGLGYLLRVMAHTAGALAAMFVNAYDVYIGIPLRIEHAVRARGGREGEEDRSDAPTRVGKPRREVVAS
jgi:hypothetical protein